MPSLVLNGNKIGGTVDDSALLRYNNEDSTLQSKTVQNAISELDEKINNKESGIDSNSSLGQGYGICSTEKDIIEKIVELTDYELIEGGVVAVKFDYAVDPQSTLNVNNKGAKPTDGIEDGAIESGDVATFMFDGLVYRLLTVDRPNAKEVYLTQADYDALGDEKLTNGVKYFITDNSNLSGVGLGVDLTLEEYNALSEEEKNNGTIYFVEDGSEIIAADNIDYDNTNSGLESDKVQGAIDELNSNIIKRTTLDYNNMTTVSSLGASGEFTADKHCRIIFRPFCQYNNTSYIWIYLSVNDKSLCTLSIKGNGSSNMEDAYNIDLNKGDILKYSVVGSDVGHSYVIVPYLA